MFLSIVVAGLLGPAAPTPVSVDWRAPVGCPDAPAVHRWVEALAGAEVRPIGESETHATGVVTTAPEGFVLELAIEGPHGASTRMLEAADCNVLGRAAAVVIGVALDPIAVVVRTQPVAHAASANDNVPLPEPPRRVAPPRETEAKTEPLAQPAVELVPRGEMEAATSWAPALEFGARVGAGVAGRVLPRAGLATEASLFLGVPRVHGRAVVQFRPQREQQLSGNTQAGAGFRLVAGGARVCPQLLPARRLRVPLCAGADFGAVRGAGVGDALATSREVRSFWAAVAVQPGMEVSVTSWFSVFMDAEISVSLSRPRFFLDNGGALHETARIAPRGMLGVQFHRPRTFW